MYSLSAYVQKDECLIFFLFLGGGGLKVDNLNKCTMFLFSNDRHTENCSVLTLPFLYDSASVLWSFWEDDKMLINYMLTYMRTVIYMRLYGMKDELNMVNYEKN